MQPDPGIKRTTDKYEVMDGLYIHYEVHEETDRAHNSYSKEIELCSVEVLNQHRPFADFPKEFESWAYKQVKEYEQV